jgi:hypothetical protein
MRGQYLEPIDDDMKERFLDLIAEGHSRPEAAKALDASPRQFRAMCNPQSRSYDEEFARQYDVLTEKGGEHDTAVAERLRAAGLDRAINRGSDRLLEKYSVIYDPEWAVHRPQAMQINFNIDEIRAEFAQLPDEALQAYVELQTKKVGELEPGLPVIDVESK